jgi:hypothetical protein
MDVFGFWNSIKMKGQFTTAGPEFGSQIVGQRHFTTGKQDPLFALREFQRAGRKQHHEQEEQEVERLKLG